MGQIIHIWQEVWALVYIVIVKSTIFLKSKTCSKTKVSTTYTCWSLLKQHESHWLIRFSKRKTYNSRLFGFLVSNHALETAIKIIVQPYAFYICNNTVKILKCTQIHTRNRFNQCCECKLLIQILMSGYKIIIIWKWFWERVWMVSIFVLHITGGNDSENIDLES
jgi:hypothetical protein